jgi:hypothetical protein
MKKLVGSLALGAMIVAFAPRAALAQGVPIKGTFTAAAAVSPNTGNVAFCGGTPLDLAVEAHGAGYSPEDDWGVRRHARLSPIDGSEWRHLERNLRWN